MLHLHLSLFLISLFLLLSILLFFHAIKLLRFYGDNSDAAVMFHFLTNNSWINCVSIVEPGIKGAIGLQFLL